MALFEKTPVEDTAICGKPISKVKDCCSLYGEDCCMYSKINT